MLLDQLLIQSRRFSAEYDDALSNHLPMTLYALVQLGATDEQLKQFYDSYVPQLEPQLTDSVQINEKNWKNYFGQHKYNSSYRAFFENEIRTHGLEKTLSTYLHELFPGVSGGAFHPLIRLAYGIEFKNEWEIAEALGSWCMAYQTLGPIKGNNSRELTDTLAAIQTLNGEYQKKSIEIQGENVFLRIKSASDSSVFKNFFEQLNLSNINLADVSHTALKIYESSRDNFTALHFVTASHAFRIISGFLENSVKETAYLFQGICAGYLAIKCPKIENSILDTSSIPSWNEIKIKGRSSTNDHVIKFTYTTLKEFEFYKNPDYQLIAAKKTGLI